MIVLDDLPDLDFREEGSHADGYTVMAVELISLDKHDDFYSGVIRTPAEEFYKLFFRFNFSSSDYEIYGHNDGILAPKQVFPKTVSRVIYE